MGLIGAGYTSRMSILKSLQPLSLTTAALTAVLIGTSAPLARDHTSSTPVVTPDSPTNTPPPCKASASRLEALLQGREPSEGYNSAGDRDEAAGILKSYPFATHERFEKINAIRKLKDPAAALLRFSQEPYCPILILISSADAWLASLSQFPVTPAQKHEFATILFGYAKSSAKYSTNVVELLISTALLGKLTEHQMLTIDSKKLQDTRTKLKAISTALQENFRKVSQDFPKQLDSIEQFTPTQRKLWSRQFLHEQKELVRGRRLLSKLLATPLVIP